MFWLGIIVGVATVLLCQAYLVISYIVRPRLAKMYPSRIRPKQVKVQFSLDKALLVDRSNQVA